MGILIFQKEIKIKTQNILYLKPNTYYLIDYIKQFWKKYKNNRKFAVLVSNDAHEGTLELVKYCY